MKKGTLRKSGASLPGLPAVFSSGFGSLQEVFPQRSCDQSRTSPLANQVVEPALCMVFWGRPSVTIESPFQ